MLYDYGNYFLFNEKYFTDEKTSGGDSKLTEEKAMREYRETYTNHSADACTSTFSSCARVNLLDAIIVASFLLCALLVLRTLVVVVLLVVITILRIMHIIIQRNADFKMTSIA